MDAGDPIIEAEVALDAEALAREQQNRKHKRGEQAAQAAKGGITTHSYAEVEERHEADEESPLLRRREDGEDDEEVDRRPSWPGSIDFQHLPWYKRPSIFWVIGPFFVMACAFGGIITPKLNLILELICREYISERMMHHPGFTRVPVDFNDGDNLQCRIPEVQSRVAQFTLWGNLLSGILAAFTSPKLGALSDRYGRKPILIITSIGTVLGEIVTIAAAKYPATFPVYLLLLSYALDGLTGSFILAMSISNAYATDCTPPNRRNVAFGYFHASLFTGIALGPILAGYIVKWTGQIVAVFYILTSVHIGFILFVALVVPESLSEKRQVVARESHKDVLSKRDPDRDPKWDWINQLRALNVLEPLKILHPTGPGSSPALRRNLLVLAAVDTIVFGVAMGSMTVIVIYMNIQFGWRTFESGRYLTIVNSCRVICLLVLLPALTRIFRGKPDSKKTKHQGSDRFDLVVLRVAICFDILGFLGFTLARTGPPFILSGVIASIGGIGSPTLQSSLTKHVPAERTGQLLGAMGLLHALARVVAPAVFNAIYSATVGSFRQTVFVCLCSTFGLAFLVSLFLRPHVYYDEDEAARTRENPPTAEQSNSEEHRLPIVSAVSAAFRAVLDKILAVFAR
ncbi:MFS general substrate transporter [Lecanosticta acicola]|uniref:MFS general substrate transporter n=1 Tax=Lecanosticta acicola TaxID=111012 RepID=A0AAI8Z229_9PEZI|nr:MFS general substrate transporter [Lecanosticta acicola]